MHCRWCGAAELDVVLDLGSQPPADLFPPVAQAASVAVTPLRMALCPRCGLAQLVEDPGVAEEPLGAEPLALVRQAEQAVVAIGALLGPGTSFAEFDSPHGGSWRALLSAAGCLDRTDDDEPVDLVVDVFGLMHEADQGAALRARVARLRPGGTLLLQYHALATIVRDRQWNALRHGHLAYYSTAALAGMLDSLSVGARGTWTFELYGGTVLLAAESGARQSPAVTALVAAEASLLSRPGLGPLAQAASTAREEIRGWLEHERASGRLVLGYGAASRAVPLLVTAGVGPGLLPAIADASAPKWGRATPVSGIPIVSPDELVARRPDRVLLFVPDLLPEVRAALPQVEAAGGRWVLSEPAPRLV